MGRTGGAQVVFENDADAGDMLGGASRGACRGAEAEGRGFQNGEKKKTFSLAGLVKYFDLLYNSTPSSLSIV